jgi:molybdate transport system substrate-binding protein
MKLILLSILLLISANLLAQEINVAVASSVRGAMEEIKTEFEKTKKIKVKLNFGSSGKLCAQIQNGTPYDVFVSADIGYANFLYSNGFATDPAKVYALSSIVLWSMKYDICKSTIRFLTDKKIKTIAIPNADSSPFGDNIIDALKRDSLYDSVKSKFVFGESVAQVNQSIFNKSADVGFTTQSTYYSLEKKVKGYFLKLDYPTCNHIPQATVLLKAQPKNRDAARDFYIFLTSDFAKKTFLKFDYSLK